MIHDPEILDVKRKPTNRGSRKIIYHYPSLINKKSVICESGLEWKLCHFLELDHASIQSYESQPHKLVYHHNNKPRRYTPDFLVIQYGVEKIIEVKPDEKLPLHLDKLQQVKTAYKLLGKQFVLITDSFIEKQPRLDNAKLILRYARQQVTRTSLKAILDFYKGYPKPVTISSLLDQLSSKKVQAGEIFKLIYAGIIKFDPETILTCDSVVWLNNSVNA